MNVLLRDININKRNQTSNPTFKVNKTIIRQYSDNNENKRSEPNKIMKVFSKFKEKLVIIQNFRETWYDKITLKLLTIPVVKDIIIFYHRIVFEYVINFTQTKDYVEKYIRLPNLLILVGMLGTRANFGMELILCSVLFMRVEFSVIAVKGFYRRHPWLLEKNFLNLSVHKRLMMSGAAKALANPGGALAAATIVGIVVSKGFDAYEASKLHEEGDKTRVVMREEGDKNRAADKEEGNKNRAADDARHKASLEADKEEKDKNRQFEREERQKDREAGKFKEEEKKKE